MRDPNHHPDGGEGLVTEKLVATLHLIMFVLIAGLGVQSQLFRTLDAAPPAAGAIALR